MDNKSPKITFTRCEEQWRYGTTSLVDSHPISDADVLSLLEKSVFINEHLGAPKQILVKERQLPVAVCEPVAVDDLDLHIRKAPKGSSDPAELILNTLIHKEFRRGATKLFDPYRKTLLHRIRKFVAAAEPVQLVLPTLPAKGQCKARNDHAIDEVSLGETLFFAQLRDIARSIQAVYAPGVKLIVVTDGIIYADMFRYNDTARAILYRNKCMTIRDLMELRDCVEVVDMDWLLQGESRFGVLKEKIHERLLSLWDSDNKAKKHLDSLMRGMLFNMPTPGDSFTRAIESINTPFDELPKNFQEKLRFTTLRYAAGQIALNRLEVVARAFPDAIRLTVHPKEAPQIGLHLVNSSSKVFPYHGVVLVSKRKLLETNSIRKASKIVPLYGIYTMQKDVTKYCLDKSSSSYYFLVDDVV